MSLPAKRGRRAGKRESGMGRCSDPGRRGSGTGAGRQAFQGIRREGGVWSAMEAPSRDSRRGEGGSPEGLRAAARPDGCSDSVQTGRFWVWAPEDGTGAGFSACILLPCTINCQKGDGLPCGMATRQGQTGGNCMGIYVNPDGQSFSDIRLNPAFVDKNCCTLPAVF